MFWVKLVLFFSSTSMTSCFKVLLLRRWKSRHNLQRNSQQSVQNATAGPLVESTQLSQLVSDPLVNRAWYPAVSMLKLSRRFLGRSETPPFGSETLFLHVWQCRVSWVPAFSTSFSRHSRQNECRHGSIRGSVYDSEQSSQMTVLGTNWFSMDLVAMATADHKVTLKEKRIHNQSTGLLAVFPVWYFLW